MEGLLQKIAEAKDWLMKENISTPEVGVILGTGLDALIHKIKIEKSISYHLIPHFPVSTVEFHKGQLIFAKIKNKNIVIMQGRFHYYEGYTMQQITFPVRVMKELGIKYLLISNAAGGINKKFKKRDLVIIKDHINLHPDNPLRGLNDPGFGNRFVDMSDPYDTYLNKLLKQCAREMNIKIKKGVYAAVSGPNLETKAEYKYLQNIGADMVGMSTVPEVIVANQVRIKCAAISVITDECNPKSLKPVNIEEIIKVAGEADGILGKLFETVIINIKN